MHLCEVWQPAAAIDARVCLRIAEMRFGSERTTPVDALTVVEVLEPQDVKSLS